MKKLALAVILTTAFLILLDSCNNETETTICVRCKMVSTTNISGGNYNLFPQQEDHCGSEADIQAFKNDFYQRADIWRNSWTWYGASTWTTQCDLY